MTAAPGSPTWRRAAPWLLLAAVVAARAPGFLFGLVNVDECDFALFGRMVAQGAAPYREVVDNKPPLTYAAFALADLVGGGHWVLVLRLLGVAVAFGTALLLRAAARASSGDDRQGWAAAGLSLAASLCDAPSVSAELLMNLPAAGALALLARAERGPRPALDAAAGAAAALATLFKQQAAVLPLAVFAARAFEALGDAPGRGRALMRLGAFAGGAAAPWAALAALFAARGGLGALYEWVVLRSLTQVGSGSPASGWRAAAALATGVGAALLPWLLAVRGALAGRGGFHRLLVILLSLTAVAVAAGGRLYAHYFLAFVPALALLGAPRLVSLRDRWPALPARLRAAAAAAALGPALGYLGYTLGRGLAGGYPGQEAKTAALAEWLARKTSPSERLFVWGDRSTVYCLSGRLPGTRYLRASFHVGDVDPEHLGPGFEFRFSEGDVESTLADLEKNRTPVVVDTAPADIHRWSLFPLGRVPPLERYLREHYRLVARPAGASVYRRISSLR